MCRQDYCMPIYVIAPFIYRHLFRILSTPPLSHTKHTHSRFSLSYFLLTNLLTFVKLPFSHFSHYKERITRETFFFSLQKIYWRKFALAFTPSTSVVSSSPFRPVTGRPATSPINLRLHDIIHSVP